MPMRWTMCLAGLFVSCAAQAHEAQLVRFGATAEAISAPLENASRPAFLLNNIGLGPAKPVRQQRDDAEEAVGVLVKAPAAGGVEPDPCAQSVMPIVTTAVTREAALRRQQYWPLVAAAECHHGLPTGLLDALVLQESRYLPTALSPAGALGLAQLMPETAHHLGVTDRLDPFANLNGGARFLRAMLDRFGSVPLALAAYNAGPGRVAGARGIPANSETPDYVRNVLNFWTARVHDEQQGLRATAELLGFVTTAGSTRTAR